MFHNCSCVEGQGPGLGNSSAVLGQCQRESCAKAFPYFLALQTACAFILALGGTPTYMIMFRWNTLPYLDHKAWGKRNRKCYSLYKLLFHSCCEEWHVDQIVPLRIYLPVLWNPTLFRGRAKYLSRNLMLSGYFGDEREGILLILNAGFQFPVIGMFFPEHWTWNKMP